MRTSQLVALLFLAVTQAPAVLGQANAAPPSRAFDDVCAAAVSGMNLLLDGIRTFCAAAESNRVLVLVTDAPVFDVPKVREAYLVVLAGAMGSALNESPAVRGHVRSVSLMDRSLGQRRAFWTIPASTLARLQADVKADRIGLERFTAAVAAAGKIENLPRKP